MGSSYVVPTARLSDLQTPADTLLVGEHGKPANVAGANYDYMTSYIQPSEGTWTAAIGPYSNGQPTKAESHNDLVFDKDCGASDTTPSCGAGWGDSPGDMPRYRHTNMTDILFSDGHVKSKVKGQLSWFKNVYIQGLYEREASANGGITGWTYPIN